MGGFPSGHKQGCPFRSSELQGEVKNVAAAELTKGTEEAKAFGQHLAEIRTEKLGMSQAELASKVTREDGSSWHTSYVTNIERGQQPPAREFIEQVASMAEMSVDEILPQGISLEDLRQAYKRRDGSGSPRRRARRAPQTAKVADLATARQNRRPNHATSNENVEVEMNDGIMLVKINVAGLVSEALSR